MIKRRVEHFRSKAAYMKYQAHIHINNIAHKHHGTVIVAGRIHHPMKDKKR